MLTLTVDFFFYLFHIINVISTLKALKKTSIKSSSIKINMYLLQDLVSLKQNFVTVFFSLEMKFNNFTRIEVK